MKGINKKIILLTVALALLMYPSTYSVLKEDIGVVYNTIKILKVNNSSLPVATSKALSSDVKKIKIIFIFDSGYDSVYENAYPLFKKYNQKANVGVIPSLTSENEYMNVSKLTNLYVDGWDILNQTFSNKADMYDNSTELLEDIQKAKKWMDNRFFTRTSASVIMPSGEINPYLIKLLRTKGYQSVRTSDNIIDISTYKIESKPIKTVHLTNSNDISMIEKFLDDTSKSNSTVVFILSKISKNDNLDNSSFSQNSLSQLLEYIYLNSDKYEVISYSDLLIE